MFTEKDRQVYTCPVTGRKYDPLQVKRDLARAARGWEAYNRVVAENANKGDQVAQPAAEGQLVGFARAAFGLKPIDPKTGDGVLDAVVLEALTAFTRWLLGKSETAGGTRPAEPCTGCP